MERYGKFKKKKSGIKIRKISNVERLEGKVRKEKLIIKISEYITRRQKSGENMRKEKVRN